MFGVDTIKLKNNNSSHQAWSKRNVWSYLLNGLVAIVGIALVTGCMSSTPSTFPTPQSQAQPPMPTASSQQSSSSGSPSQPSSSGSPSQPSNPSSSNPSSPSSPSSSNPNPLPSIPSGNPGSQPNMPSLPNPGSNDPNTGNPPAGGNPNTGEGAPESGQEGQQQPGEGANGPEAGSEVANEGGQDGTNQTPGALMDLPSDLGDLGGQGGWEVSNQIPIPDSGNTEEESEEEQENGSAVDGDGEEQGEFERALQEAHGTILAERNDAIERSNHTVATEGGLPSNMVLEDDLGGIETTQDTNSKVGSHDNPDLEEGNMGVEEVAADLNQIVDTPDATDDEIVARQLKEAALAEEDPDVRKKLWEEYETYKKGLK